MTKRAAVKAVKPETKTPEPNGADEALSKLSGPHKSLIEALSDKERARLRKGTFRTKNDQGRIAFESNLSDKYFDGLLLCDALGGGSAQWASSLVDQLGKVGAQTKDPDDMAESLGAGISFVQSAEPRNAMEGALLVQMYAMHRLTVAMARRAQLNDDMDWIKLGADQANKCARTFAAQVEALAKLRNGGKQQVEVKYVDARNSQNVFADSITTGGGGPQGKSHQPHAQGLEYQPGAPVDTVRSQDTVRDAMPVARVEG